MSALIGCISSGLWTVEAVFFEFDDDRDGRVNFAQFERMWLRGV
jgi:hypothetical protein